ncbi:hypothetical protein [Candidatus Desulfovibrio trichonymphae]|uniref:Uncharacterized protein n=1 Tax=Candidatus Desulfovibrio trichonymphae TaxID=1725232 RepID=A0A1J1E420_9BACT|nr:hypothetical protein [Candidatus Desulfovibrio trichonymphae]BAV92200.1 conserved hypothetical protein [Candidatus Desulfovibrio trichonymphae]GHU92189.1 hypothetical protein AGMMS49925_09790 [Deltaproteobacteria bacterium]GHU99381.1 hypothetical protein AGMMS50248_07400 [Deltaproteobacteria bacterium]
MQNTAEIFDPESAGQQALKNFEALLGDMDFTVELELMGIGRLQFLLRRQMLLEWRSLYMALWRLALDKSFPHDAGRIFDAFVRDYSAAHPDKQSAAGLVRAGEYWGMLAPAGETDFNPAARHLVSFFSQDVKELRSMRLKLALHIRKIYKSIFDRLL